MCELENALKYCNAEEASKVVSEIMGSNDISYLRELSKTYEKLIPIIVSLQESRNTDDLNKKAKLSKLANFLSEVNLSGCRCGTYRTSGGIPEAEQEKGFVIICEDPRNSIDTVICECSFCNKKFSVHTYDSSFSYTTEWKKCS